MPFLSIRPRINVDLEFDARIEMFGCQHFERDFIMRIFFICRSDDGLSR